MFFVKDNYYDLQPSINPPCFFQFYKFQDQKYCQSPIVFITSNLAPDVFSDFSGNINCRWFPNSLYYGLNPLEVYEKHIQLYINNSLIPLFTTGLLCYCGEATHPDCSTNKIRPIYPGQHILLNLAINSEIRVWCYPLDKT